MPVDKNKIDSNKKEKKKSKISSFLLRFCPIYAALEEKPDQRREKSTEFWSSGWWSSLGRIDQVYDQHAAFVQEQEKQDCKTATFCKWTSDWAAGVTIRDYTAAGAALMGQIRRCESAGVQTNAEQLITMWGLVFYWPRSLYLDSVAWRQPRWLGFPETRFERVKQTVMRWASQLTPGGPPQVLLIVELYPAKMQKPPKPERAPGRETIVLADKRSGQSGMEWM